MEKIKKLIKDGDLDKARNEIDVELRKSFNLSEEKSRKKYIELGRLKIKVKRLIKESRKNKNGKYIKKLVLPAQRILKFRIANAAKDPELFNYPNVGPDAKEIESKLLEITKTKDIAYKEDLAALAYAIDEEDIPILFYGEIGVGKSYLAERIHTVSKRKNNKFVTVNCAGLSETNLYPNLFGAEKGSFTGSIKPIKGMIKEADGGTLFIDEIDKAPKEIRYHLMTFIDTKKYYPLGNEKYNTADVRLLVGTNKDLKQLVAKGEFEADLYSRIIGRMIYIPALRERKNDISRLIKSILDDFNSKNKNKIKVDKSALQYLVNYSWPQNVRQLRYYLLLRFGDCQRTGKTVLTLELIKQKPPEQMAAYQSNDFFGFESLMKSYLENWEISSGKYLTDFIEPVVAKIYLEDYNPHINQSKKYSNATNILGISGERRKDSTLHKQYLKYDVIKNKLS